MDVVRKILPFLMLFLGILIFGSGWVSISNKDARISSSVEASAEFGPIPLVDRSVPPYPSPESQEGAQRPFVGEALLMRKMSRRLDDLPVTTHADGRRSMPLNGRFTMMSASVIGPDGKKKVQCFSGFREMKTALTEKANPLPPTHASY